MAWVLLGESVLLLAGVARGQDFVRELEATVVSAAKVEGDARDVPYRVEQLDSVELFERSVRSVPEALDGLAGVSVQKTANGHGSPYIRGFTGYRTLAVVDGVRYNNSIYRDGPSEYFGLIDVQSLGSVELLLGPGSTLYGSDAIGGTLFLRTKEVGLDDYADGEWFSGGEHRLRVASGENSFQNRLEYAFGEGGKWGFRFGVSQKEYGAVRGAGVGVQKHTGYDEYAGDVSFEYRFNDFWTLKMHHDRLVQDDVWRTHSTIYGVSFAGTTVGSDLRRLKDQERSLSYVRLSGRELGGGVDELDFTFSYQTWDEDGDRILGDGRRRLESFDSRMWGLDVEASSELFGGTLRYGVDYYEDSVDSGRTDYNADGSLDRVRVQGPVGDDARFGSFGAFAQMDREVGERFRVIGGVRYTHVNGKVGTLSDPVTGGAISFEDSWDALVGSLRVTADVSEDLMVWAGLSQAFRAPNLADVSRLGGSRSSETEVAALDLDSEHFLTGEVGVKYTGSKAGVDVSYYFTDIRDYITSTPTGRVVGGLTEVTKKNSAEGYVQGVEVSGYYDFDEHWRANFQASWLDGEIDAFEVGSSDARREPISRLSPVMVGAGLRWQDDGGRKWLRMDARYVGKADELSEGDEGDTQRIPPGGTPDYFLLDVSGGYGVTEDWDLVLGLKNVLDEAYRVHGSGVNAAGFGVYVSSVYRF